MERGVLAGDEKREGVILAFYSWATTPVFSHTLFFGRKKKLPAITLFLLSLYRIIPLGISSLTVAQLFLGRSIWAVFSQSI